MSYRSALPGRPEGPLESRLVGSERVLAVLRELARYPGGAELEEIARSVDSPKPTVHRALAALCRAGFAARDGRGHYVLGDEFLRMAFVHHENRPDHLRVAPILEALSRRFGETAHYAVLDGTSVVYRSKVDPPTRAVRLTSTVGGRNPAHCTAVGKALLAASLPDDAAIRGWMGDRTLERPTGHSKTDAGELCAELRKTRERGYSIDDQENETGIVCVAFPVFLTSPTVPSGAISVSALAYRTPLSTLLDDLPAIRSIINAPPGAEPLAARQ